MTKVYLIRHAEAEGNLYRIAQGHMNGLITERGYQQIAALERRFAAVPIDAVYSSDLIRTCTTARAIYVPKHLPLHRDPAFREILMGTWEGRTWQDLAMEDEQQLYYFNCDLTHWHPEGSETPQQVLDRYLPALHRVAAAHEGGTVAVFSHGAAMRVVLGTLQGLSLREIGQTPHGDNTAVSLLEVEPDGIRVVYRDDNSHLADSGLSTLARQNWWKDKRMKEEGAYYRPVDEASRRQLEQQGVTVPEEGENIAIHFGHQTVGLVQLLPDRADDAGWIGTYWLSPDWRGRHLGIPPLGQAVFFYRARGIDRLRLDCADPHTRGFFARFGFRPLEGDTMEKYIGPPHFAD